MGRAAGDDEEEDEDPDYVPDQVSPGPCSTLPGLPTQECP